MSNKTGLGRARGSKNTVKKDNLLIDAQKDMGVERWGSYQTHEIIQTKGREAKKKKSEVKPALNCFLFISNATEI